MTDRSLIDNVLAGDPAAERALYDAHVDRVWGMVYRFAGDAERAADWTQETFIRVFARLAEFRGESSLGTWIGSIAISVALSGLRSAGRHERGRVDLEPEVAAPGPAEADPDLRDRIRTAVASLGEHYRAVFLLHDVEGYTHEEIAEMLEVETGTSKARLSRARARLRAALAAYA
jgi:RNA polymerase sigma-70 factor (ECF subfamily)